MKILLNINLIIGTIIGGGFISGEEINIFFNTFENYGILGIIVSVSVICITVWKILKMPGIKTYEDLIDNIIPIKNEKVKLLFLSFINVFLLTSYYIMCSAFTTLIYDTFMIPKIITAIFLSIASLILINKGIKSLKKINFFLIFFIIIILFVIFINSGSIKVISSGIFDIKNTSFIFSIFSAITYASYNLIILIPLVISLKKEINDKKARRKVVFLIFGILVLIAMIIFFLIKNEGALDSQMPMITITKNMSKEIYYFYTIIAIFSIFTSAMSALYSTKLNINRNFIVKIIVLLSIPFSFIKFSTLVSIMYNTFGIIGIIQIFFILIS